MSSASDKLKADDVGAMWPLAFDSPIGVITPKESQPPFVWGDCFGGQDLAAAGFPNADTIGDLGLCQDAKIHAHSAHLVWGHFQPTALSRKCVVHGNVDACRGCWLSQTFSSAIFIVVQ